jgi:menaquinone-dependent protoporphyrinogen oxidase
MMQPEVLVAYVTRSGSTGEVAEAVAKTLSEAGVRAEAKLMQDVSSISDDASVILGAALYAGHVPKEFHQVVERFQHELSNDRPWVFVLGPTEDKPKFFVTAEEQARRELAKHPWLHTADVRVLGGKFDPKHLHLPFPFSLAMKLPGNPMRRIPASDIRDWEWIKSWARAIGDHLNTAA